MTMGTNNKQKAGQKLRNSFACVVDGETEIWYLNMLKRNEAPMKSISIRPELPQKKTLEEQFKQVQTLAESYTAVFWIIDTDTIIRDERAYSGDRMKSPKAVLKKCVSTLPDNAIFISNTPCFEFWVLLHILKTTKYYETGDAVIEQLHKNELLEDYSKTRKYFTQEGNDIYKRLKPYLAKAIVNSKATGEFDYENLEKGFCSMHKLFTRLGLDTETVQEEDASAQH